MVEIFAVLCAGTFFGASIYINLVQHPATLDVGGDFAVKFFPPMYKRASTMQIALAITGTVLGIIAWFFSENALWLLGSICLVSVIPITLLCIKKINDQLLYPEQALSTEVVMTLLRAWNPRHWIRGGVSFLGFVCYLVAIAG